LQLLCNHFAITLQSLCNHFAITLQLQSLCNHFAIALQHSRNKFNLRRYAAASSWLINNISVSLQCKSFNIFLFPHSPSPSSFKFTANAAASIGSAFVSGHKLALKMTELALSSSGAAATPQQSLQNLYPTLRFETVSAHPLGDIGVGGSNKVKVKEQNVGGGVDDDGFTQIVKGKSSSAAATATPSTSSSVASKG
jgi:hypothetical protein